MAQLLKVGYDEYVNSNSAIAAWYDMLITADKKETSQHALCK